MKRRSFFRVVLGVGAALALPFPRLFHTRERAELREVGEVFRSALDRAIAQSVDSKSFVEAASLIRDIKLDPKTKEIGEVAEREGITREDWDRSNQRLAVIRLGPESNRLFQKLKQTLRRHDLLT